MGVEQQIKENLWFCCSQKKKYQAIECDISKLCMLLE